MSAENEPECKPLVLLSAVVADYDLFVQQFKARGHTEDAQECKLFQLIDVVVDMLAATGLKHLQHAAWALLDYTHTETHRHPGTSAHLMIILGSEGTLRKRNRRRTTKGWTRLHAHTLSLFSHSLNLSLSSLSYSLGEQIIMICNEPHMMHRLIHLNRTSHMCSRLS